MLIDDDDDDDEWVGLPLTVGTVGSFSLGFLAPHDQDSAIYYISQTRARLRGYSKRLKVNAGGRVDIGVVFRKDRGYGCLQIDDRRPIRVRRGWEP